MLESSSRPSVGRAVALAVAVWFGLGVVIALIEVSTGTDLPVWVTGALLPAIAIGFGVAYRKELL